MFKRLARRFRDVRALSDLMQSAKNYARVRGEGSNPSAEHFVLAAVVSKDESARKVFQILGLDAADFEGALRQQYINSLPANGEDVSEAALQVSADIDKANNQLFEMTESGRELIQNMYRQKTENGFFTVDVLRAIDSVQVGPAHRALIVMGTTAEQVTVAANQSIE